MIEAAGFQSIEKIVPDDYSEPWQVDHTDRVIYLCRA